MARRSPTWGAAPGTWRPGWPATAWSTVGIDLSPGMIAVGRREYPAVEFREGDLLELPAADGEFAAAVALYSIIHLRPGELGPAFDEIHRVLRSGALFLVAFHVGSEVRHLAEWWGHAVDVDFRFFQPPDIAEAIECFRIEMRLERLSYPARSRRAAHTCWPGASREPGRARMTWTKRQNDLSGAVGRPCRSILATAHIGRDVACQAVRTGDYRK